MVFVIMSAMKDLKHSSNASTFSTAPSFSSSLVADPSLSFRMTNGADLSS